MSIVVRISIQKQGGMGTSPGEQVVAIVDRFGGQPSAQEAGVVGRNGFGRRILDVLGSPGRPQSIHEVFPAEAADHERLRPRRFPGRSRQPVMPTWNPKYACYDLLWYHARNAVSRPNPPTRAGFSTAARMRCGNPYRKSLRSQIG